MATAAPPRPSTPDASDGDLGGPDALEAFHPAVAEWFRRRFPDGPTAAGAGLAAHRRGHRHADRRADRLGQDARRLPRRHRPPVPGPRLGYRRRERCARRVRVAAQGAGRRHRREPRAAARRDRRGGGGARSRRAHAPRCRPHGRHHELAARVDVAAPAELRGDHPRVAVPARHQRQGPRDAAHHGDGHRRRDPRGRDKRGAHLAVTLERLEALCDQRPSRVGLSATQRPDRDDRAPARR